MGNIYRLLYYTRVRAFFSTAQCPENGYSGFMVITRLAILNPPYNITRLITILYGGIIKWTYISLIICCVSITVSRSDCIQTTAIRFTQQRLVRTFISQHNITSHYYVVRQNNNNQST